MNKHDKIFLCFGIFGLIAGALGLGFKPKFLNKLSNTNKKNIIPFMAIASGIISLFFVADDFLLPEQEEVNEEV